MAAASAPQAAPYRGFSDAVKQIYREEGLAGFYRGLLPSLLLVLLPYLSSSPFVNLLSLNTAACKNKTATSFDYLRRRIEPSFNIRVVEGCTLLSRAVILLFTIHVLDVLKLKTSPCETTLLCTVVYKLKNSKASDRSELCFWSVIVVQELELREGVALS